MKLRNKLWIALVTFASTLCVYLTLAQLADGHMGPTTATAMLALSMLLFIIGVLIALEDEERSAEDEEVIQKLMYTKHRDDLTVSLPKGLIINPSKTATQAVRDGVLWYYESTKLSAAKKWLYQHKDTVNWQVRRRLEGHNND